MTLTDQAIMALGEERDLWRERAEMATRDRDAHAARAQELARRVTELETFARRLLQEHGREPVDETALYALLVKGAVLT